SGCTASSIGNRDAKAVKHACGAGVTHKVTGPIAAAQAVSTVRSISRACSAAAPAAPSAGISRVFTDPATGALARIASATGSGVADAIAVLPRQPGGLRAEEEREAQPPHRENGAHD